MEKMQIDFSHVLKHMRNVKEEFQEIVDELELLSNKKVRKQIEDSMEAGKKGKIIKFSLDGFKKSIGL